MTPYTAPRMYRIDPAVQYPGDGAILRDMLRRAKKSRRRRARYAANPESEREYTRRWREAHPGYKRPRPGNQSARARLHALAYARAYYAAHRDKICEDRRRKYREAKS